MNTLPSLYVHSRFVGDLPSIRTIGAVDLTDSTLTSMAQTLNDYLNANGCQQASLQVVSDFQAAWISAGGTLPQDSGGRSPVDGYYGPNTAAALRQLYPNAVAGCVGRAPGPTPSPPIPLTVLPSTNWLSISSVSTTMAQHPWLTALFFGVAIAATYVNWGKMRRRSYRHSRPKSRLRKPRGRRRSLRRLRRRSRRRR
jgi:hypothetical protein